MTLKLKNKKKEKISYSVTVKGEEENCVAWKLQGSCFLRTAIKVGRNILSTPSGHSRM